MTSHIWNGKYKSCSKPPIRWIHMGYSWVIKCPHFSHHPTMNGISGLFYGYFFRWCPIYQNGTVTNPCIWAIYGPYPQWSVAAAPPPPGWPPRPRCRAPGLRPLRGATVWGRGRGGVWPWWRWDIGGYEQLALAIWAKYITINMKKSVGPFTVKIYHNWMGIYTKYLGPYSVGIEVPKYITICWNNSRLECEKDGVSLESVQWGRKIWLLAQALSTWVAPLILGI